VNYVEWKLSSVCLEKVLISVPNRCTVCAKCTTSKEILLAAPDGLLGDVGQMEARFGLFGDSVNQHAR
jgi:hypothetical protein